MLAPSLLSADFSNLANDIHQVESAGVDWLHLDVMDGHFVPNITIGPLVVQAIRPITKLPLDCHLMVSEPEKWIKPFADAGADWITVHQEVSEASGARSMLSLIRAIHAAGKKAGISINPATPLDTIEPILDEVDLVLIMSVNPGFGGQKFESSAIPKIQKLVTLRKKRNYLIEIDGGVGPDNIASLKQAGVDVVVAGSAIFGSKNNRKNIKTSIQELKSKWTS